jgi:hypothetical protein
MKGNRNKSNKHVFKSQICNPLAVAAAKQGRSVVVSTIENGADSKGCFGTKVISYVVNGIRKSLICSPVEYLQTAM